MITEIASSLAERTRASLNMHKLRILLEILVAFLPILVLGIIGTRLGTDTLLGGMLVTLGYILSILVATVVLKLRGSSWRQIGLTRPQSWKRNRHDGGLGVLCRRLDPQSNNPRG